MERMQYGPRWQSRTGDIETWLGNSVATIVAALAVAAGVIGLLVAFGYIGTTVNTPFENGIMWMGGGVILAISATVFRREHHVVDPGDSSMMGRDYRSSDARPVSTGAPNVPPHTH